MTVWTSGIGVPPARATSTHRRTAVRECLPLCRARLSSTTATVSPRPTSSPSPSHIHYPKLNKRSRCLKSFKRIVRTCERLGKSFTWSNFDIFSKCAHHELGAVLVSYYCFNVPTSKSEKKKRDKLKIFQFRHTTPHLRLHL